MCEFVTGSSVKWKKCCLWGGERGERAGEIFANINGEKLSFSKYESEKFV